MRVPMLLPICLYMSNMNMMVQLRRTFCSVSHWRPELAHILATEHVCPREWTLSLKSAQTAPELWQVATARIREVAVYGREAMTVKKMPDKLKSLLHFCLRVNFTKSRLMNSRLFLCNEIGSEHVQLLHHTEVRWLLGGMVLLCSFIAHIHLTCW